jgi:hypothetical protein
MKMADFAGKYEAKTDEELLRLAMDSDQLTADAQGCLASELAKRGISAERVRAFRDRPEPIPSPAIIPAADSYLVGPSLSRETSKAPWRPKVAGRIAFFFGPVAGALVVVVSLRRMGHPQSGKKVLRLALGMAAAEAVIMFFIPDALARRVAFGAEIAFLLIFPVFMENEFSEWQRAHPSALPSNGWNAIGWGLVGAAMLVIIFFLIFIGLAALSPAGH